MIIQTKITAEIFKKGKAGIKRQSIEGEKIFSNYSSDKELGSQRHKLGDSLGYRVRP